MTVYDVIVVGAGIEGLSTACFLQSHSSKRVLVLEQFPFPHWRGSSAGVTRITRLAYRRPEYVRLMKYSHEQWNRLQNIHSAPLYKQTGCLVLGSKAQGGKLSQYTSALESEGVASTRLSSADVNRKYGHLLTCPDDYDAMWEPDGGILMNQNCLKAFASEFIKHGGTLKDHTKVLDIIPRVDTVTLVTTCGVKYSAKTVVLTMGPWTTSFLSSRMNLKVPSVAQRTKVCYWKEKENGLFSLQNGTPAVLITEPDFTYFFKPSFEYHGLTHFGVHYGEAVHDVDHPDKTSMTEAYMNKCTNVINKFDIKIAAEPSLVEYCIYQECPDGDFILDKHPRHSNVVFGTGFTGHGFKLAPAVGRILAKLATNVQLLPEERVFSMDRFNKSKL